MRCADPWVENNTNAKGWRGCDFAFAVNIFSAARRAQQNLTKVCQFQSPRTQRCEFAIFTKQHSLGEGAPRSLRFRLFCRRSFKINFCIMTEDTILFTSDSKTHCKSCLACQFRSPSVRLVWAIAQLFSYVQNKMYMYKNPALFLYMSTKYCMHVQKIMYIF